jgi:4-amino-4-deoxy-L-arabinose transferase-like glycosyltransferase
MERLWDVHAVDTNGSALDAPLPGARPVFRPTPRSVMFFPLVVLVGVLPGLYALSRWDLNPPGPWWGLRGLAVVQGRLFDQVPAWPMTGSTAEAEAYRAVAWQPPLYAWLEAAGLALSSTRSPLATVLPSFVAGALVVVLVYLQGRLWRGPAVGLAAALLTAFNPELLHQAQQATPITVALAGMLLALWAYGQNLRAECVGWKRVGWGIAQGLGLGAALMAVGLFGLLGIPVVAMHQLYLSRTDRPRPWPRPTDNPAVVAGVVALFICAAVVLPWHIWMYTRYGDAFLRALLSPPDAQPFVQGDVLKTMIALAPATLPLCLFAALRAVQRSWAQGPPDATASGHALWLAWLAVASLSPRFWPAGPNSALDLFLLMPLNLLAAQGLTDLAARRVRLRALVWLAPATFFTFVCWASVDLRASLGMLLRGHSLDPEQALVLHVCLDLVAAAALTIYALVRWSRHCDRRKRLAIGGFLSLVVAATMVTGIREVRFRHLETKELLSLREAVLRRHREQPFTLVAIVGPETSSSAPAPPPGGRLRFILQTALPTVPQVDIARADELLNLPPGERLVILVGQERLPYALQARLGLWAIHPGRTGILDAFATARDLETTLPR